jgi:hypothetical protein
MPQLNLKFGDTGQLEPEDDDISNNYMLSRQVAHEYHSSATQTYINAESAAQQAAVDEATQQKKDFERKQSEKKAAAQTAEGDFADTMMESLAARRPDVSKSAGPAGAKVAPEGGGGGWGDESAPSGMPSESKKIQAETGGIENPMIDPTQAMAAGAGSAFKLSMSAGKALMPSLARAVTAGVVNVATDPLYGTAADVAGASNPALALPFNLAVGLLGGMTLEPAIERGITRAAKAAGKVLDAAQIAEQVQMMKGVLANEAGMVEVWHGSPHKFDKADMSKVGTGEGAQAFGHGLYFTDKKEIASHYAKMTKYSEEDIINAKKYLTSKTEYKTIKDVEDSWGYRNQNDYVVLAKSHGYVPKNDTGSTYRAQLFPGKDPSEYTFLDWYEPVPKENSVKILKALRSEGVIDYAEFDKAIKEGITGEDLYKWLSGTDLGKEKIKLRKEWEAAQKRRDWDNYEKKYLEWEELETSKYPQKDASDFLKRAGIDGIRYPTESLSGKGPKGGDAFNYVVFDDRDVRLVSRESGGAVDDLTKRAVVEFDSEFKIEKIDIDDIEYAHELTHKPSSETIKEYHKMRGETALDPIIITDDNRVIDGAGRLSENRHLKRKEIDVIKIPLTYDEITEASNSIGRSTDALRAEVSKVVYEYTGFSKRAKQIVDETDYYYDDQAKELLGIVSRESGGKVDDLTKQAVIEEINAEIGKHPVEDALRILKNQRGEIVVRQGEEATPPAILKSKEQSDKFLSNPPTDITEPLHPGIRLFGSDYSPKFVAAFQSDQDIAKALAGGSDILNSEIEEMRRGVRSWEKTHNAGKEIKLEDILGRKVGEAENAEWIDRARVMTVTSGEYVNELRRKINNKTATDLDKLEFRKAWDLYSGLLVQTAGARAEAGRSVNIFKKFAATDLALMRDIKKLTEINGKPVEEIAKMMEGMDNPSQVAAFVKQTNRATTWGMFIEAWINGLLSGPVTHSVNMTSNALTTVWMIPERLLASGISKLHGGEIRGGEAASQAYGLIAGVKDGFKLAFQALKTGEGSDLMGKVEQQQQRAISAKNVQELPLIKKLAPNALEEGGMAARFVDVLGEAVRGPGRFLTAEDEFFKAIGYRMELQAQAYRMASKEGLEGADMARRMQEIISDPQNLAPDVHLAAIDSARYQTFTNELGGAGKAVQAFSNKMPGAKLVIPFIRTPANIMKFALERNLITAPFFKQVRADIMAGGPRMDMALSRIAMGSMGMGVVATYAASGMITGGGPSDTDLRAHKYNTGWQPYSIKIGDTYHAYGRLEPLGMMMGLAADAVEIMGELDEMESDKIATTIVAAIGKNVMSKTWLRGMSEMINAMEDPDRYGSKYVKQLAGTAVPTGVAQIEKTLHPEMSDAQSALDAIKARIPGYSKDLPTRRNLWGEKIQFNGALGPDIISPIFTSKEKDSPIDKELLRMKAPIKMPGRSQTFEGVPTKLDANEYEEFIVRMNGIKLDVTGKTLKKSLNELVTKDRDYKSLKDDRLKEKMIESYIEEATNKARIEMLETNQEIRKFVDNEHRIKSMANQ